jgi:hypothetical protein
VSESRGWIEMAEIPFQTIDISADAHWRSTDEIVGRAMRRIYNLSKMAWDRRTQDKFAAIKSQAVGDAIAQDLDAAYVANLMDMLVPR